jgi:hypothetical protein
VSAILRRRFQLFLLIQTKITLFPPGEPLGHAEAARAGKVRLAERVGLAGRGGGRARREETG